MAAVSEDYISTIVQKVASVQGVQNVQFKLEKFKNIAQNYFGIIIPIVLSGEQNGQEVKLEIVLKLAPTDERYRVSGAVTDMFAREIFVYSVILKAYQDLQQYFPVHLKYMIPSCYYVQKEYCKEAIAMQNMYTVGYKPYIHAMFLDFDHIIISLKSLAKLHALSFIIEHKNPDLFNEITKTCVPLTETSSKRYMDIMRDRLDKAINVFKGTQYLLLLQIYAENCAMFFDVVNTVVKKTCICHGDIWKENILYKYENEKPVSACLIDYQSTRISSLAFDTLYLIISSTSTDLRRDHYNQLWDIYYQTFDQILKEGGLESEKVYSRKMLDHDLKVVTPACIITANCALWLSNGLQEEGHVRSKLVLNTPEEKDLAIQKYQGIITAIIDDCCSYGYIHK